jgi:phosphatidylinositol alpha-mannosyltransferase
VIIAFVLDDTLDRPDGVQQYILVLGRWLTSRGHVVHYLVTQTLRTDIPNVHAVGGYVKAKFNGNSVRTPRPVSNRKIKALLTRLKPDVLHVQMPYSPLFAARVIMAAPPATRIVGTFHILPSARWHATANRLLARWLKTSLSRVAAVIAVSRPAAQFAHTIYGLSPVVIAPPVNLAISSPRPARDSASKLRIVFLGRLVARKGVLELIRAYKALPKHVRGDCRLVIGGDGPLMTRARNSAGVSDDITFTGFVPETDKTAFLGSADIAVFPSTGGESFGIVLVEAMSAGAGVVLGGNNPGYASVLAVGADSLVEPNDTPSFAAILQRYITDEDRRSRLHEDQARLVRQFDVELIGPKIEAIY